MTLGEADVYRFIAQRHASGQITMRSDIETQTGKEKSWVCRILQSLVGKGVIERYDRQYYKLTTKGN